MKIVEKLNYLKIALISTIFIAFVLLINQNPNIPTLAETNTITLPILMYHSICAEESQVGDYVITPTNLENDIIYLQENGYEFILIEDLIAYYYLGTPLPEKPVMLTFDDGYYNNYYYLPDLLAEYDAKGVISVTGVYLEQYTIDEDNNLIYAMMNWTEVGELAENLNIEIQNHSYDMHSMSERSGSARLEWETTDEYREFFLSDILFMENELATKSGINTTTFTYPYGQISYESEDFLKEAGFLASLSCYEHINYLKGESATELFQLGRFNREGGISTIEFMTKIGI